MDGQAVVQVIHSHGAPTTGGCCDGGHMRTGHCCHCYHSASPMASYVSYPMVVDHSYCRLDPILSPVNIVHLPCSPNPSHHHTPIHPQCSPNPSHHHTPIHPQCSPNPSHHHTPIHPQCSPNPSHHHTPIHPHPVPHHLASTTSTPHHSLHKIHQVPTSAFRHPVPSLPTPKKTEKIIPLKKWYFRVWPGDWITLEGYREVNNGASELWRTGPIAERLSPTLLLTKSRSHYRLVGALDRTAMRQSGKSLPVSERIANKFKYGFPRNWTDLVQKVKVEAVKELECLTATSRSEKVNVKQEHTEFKKLPSIRIKKEKVVKAAPPLAPPLTDPIVDPIVDPITVTAKLGTMKRKRQFQNVVSHLDKGYSDNIFDATPLKKMKKFIPEIPEDQKEDCDVLVRDTPSGSWRAKLGAPISRTPKLLSCLDSPRTVTTKERNAVIAKRSKKAVVVKKVPKPAAPRRVIKSKKHQDPLQTLMGETKSLMGLLELSSSSESDDHDVYHNGILLS